MLGHEYEDYHDVATQILTSSQLRVIFLYRSISRKVEFCDKKKPVSYRWIFYHGFFAVIFVCSTMGEKDGW